MTDNIVYIGNKPPMTYVLAVLRTFTQVGADNVILKARGQAISRAVDVAEISRRRFLTDVEVTRIEIGSEQLPTQDGGTRGVSSIAVTMTKKVKAGAPEAPATPVASPLDVSEIKGVGGARAKKLREAGFSTAESLAKAASDKLSELTGLSEKVSAKIIESAKELLKKK